MSISSLIEAPESPTQEIAPIHSLLPSSEFPSSEIVPYTNGYGNTGINSLVAQPAQIQEEQTEYTEPADSASPNAAELATDPYSNELAFRKEDGSLMINIPNRGWNGTMQISDLERKDGIKFDHVTVRADYIDQIDNEGRIVKDETGKPIKYTLITAKQIGYRDVPVKTNLGTQMTKEYRELGSVHTVRLGAKIKSTSLPADREDEVYMYVDAIRSITRRLEEAEVELKHLPSGVNIKEERPKIMRKYGCSDLFEMVTRNSEATSISDDVLKERDQKLPNMIRDIHRVN
jgi:hypothetical protein